MIVVKVGGSLFDHLRLGEGLRAYLDSLAPSEVLLVPGGGPLADTVRELDRVHGLGEEASHWLAVRAMDVMGDVLRALFRVGQCFAQSHLLARGGTALEDSLVPPYESRIAILDCLTFLRDDDSRPGALPDSWAVTSDSIAARAAIVLRAERLVLLKSVDVPQGTPWEEAAARGWVDDHFPRAVEGAAFVVEVVNFRSLLESLPVKFLDDYLGEIGR